MKHLVVAVLLSVAVTSWAQQISFPGQTNFGSSNSNRRFNQQSNRRFNSNQQTNNRQSVNSNRRFNNNNNNRQQIQFGDNPFLNNNNNNRGSSGGGNPFLNNNNNNNNNRGTSSGGSSSFVSSQQGSGLSAQCQFGQCQPLSLCPDLLSGTAAQVTTNLCDLGDGTEGACCQPQTSSSGIGGRRQPFSKPFKNVAIQFFDNNQLNTACRTGINEVSRQEDLGRSLKARNIVVFPNTPSQGHLNFFRTTRQALDLGNQALFNAEACKRLLQENNLTPDQGAFGLQQFSVLNTIINTTCPSAPPCRNSKYRTYDGSCNNRGKPTWGMSRTALQRILEPSYQDGIFTPRVASDGGALPSARAVSRGIGRSNSDIYPDLTLGVMQWGQFLDHDITHSPIFRLDTGTGIECCGQDGRILPAELRHDQCFPIEVPDGDPHPRRCINFVRSLPAPRPECNFGYAEQMNQLTQFIDASNIYGSDREEADKLRAFRGGELRESSGGRLPINNDEDEECFATSFGSRCYSAGDSRVNEQIQLTVMHTIWMREHNRVARELQRLNPHWNDEKLYQEARHIVAAIFQHITYNEWLPIVLGREFLRVYGLETLRSGYSNDYRPDINPSITNEFATAAFRFGHTLIQDLLGLYGPGNRRDGAIQLRDAFNNPHELTKSGVLERLARGMYLQKAQKFDENFVTDITDHLFQPVGGSSGMDLIALNIQRGREHGIPSYNNMRQQCGLPRASSMDDFRDQLKPEVIASLKRVYRSPDDVDLFIAGIAEKPVPGALLGHTFLCIVGDQFARLRKGDRFFYDLGGQPGSFTEAQLHEIRKSSWARIMCDNVAGVDKVQPLAFYAPSFRNPLQSCSGHAIPTLTLDAWRE